MLLNPRRRFGRALLPHCGALAWRRGESPIPRQGDKGIRRHYAWLRRRLQEKGLTQVVKRIGGREGRVVNAILHRVSKQIVSLALASNSCIVLGDLTGISGELKARGTPQQNDQ